MKAVYPGTFDPVTYGHLDIIEKALRIFGKLTVAIGENPSKSSFFSTDERVDMLKKVTQKLDIEVDKFSGLLVDYLKRKNINIIIRSLRAVSDFDYEFQMALVNRELANDIDTIFLLPDKEYFYLDSSAVKQIAKYKNKNLSKLVPKPVEEKLREKFGK